VAQAASERANSEEQAIFFNMVLNSEDYHPLHDAAPPIPLKREAMDLLHRG
jgi:hypothetical protein